VSDPQKKLFSYRVDVEAVPYVSETSTYWYGENVAYNPNYPEDIFAQEVLLGMITDATTHVLRMQMDCISGYKLENEETIPEGPVKIYWQWLKDKLEKYRQIEKSVKLLVEGDSD
jgi:hypothetical protein